MVIGIYNSIEEAKRNLDNKITTVGSRIIILGSDQTTYEWVGDTWKNINGIFLQGRPGEDGRPGKDGNDAKIDYDLVTNMLYNKLIINKSFIDKCKGRPGEDGKPGKDGENCIPDINLVIKKLVEKLMENMEFINMIKGKDGEPGKDGFSPKKGIDYNDGKDGEDGKPGKDGEDGENGWSIKLIEGDVNIGDKELGIGLDKSLYIKHNNTILKL